MIQDPPPSFAPDPSRRRSRTQRRGEAPQLPLSHDSEHVEHPAQQIPPSFAPRGDRTIPPSFQAHTRRIPPEQRENQRKTPIHIFPPSSDAPSNRRSGSTALGAVLFKRIGIALIILALLLTLWVTFVTTDISRHFNRVEALSGAQDTPGTTWLVTGSDSRADGVLGTTQNVEGQRADSIMLVHQAPNGQSSTISLPRDTYVSIPDNDWSKINASYSWGGAPLLIKTVEELSGLTIDHYVEIGMGGVKNIVDAVGGLELCYDRDVDDIYSKLKWQAGCHEADGATALAFSRMRYEDPRGDIGRAERQRQVVGKLMNEVLAPATFINPSRTLSVGRAGAQAVTVDEASGTFDLLKLALAFRSANQEGLTGTPPIENPSARTKAGSSVLLVDKTAPDFFARLRSGELTTGDFNQP